MKKRIALVRGPNLNSWEMQNFALLTNDFEFVGFTTYGHNFDVSAIPFPVKKLFSVGQTLRAHLLRNIMSQTVGDYHDLVGLHSALDGFDIVHSAEMSHYCTYQAACAKRKTGYKLIVTVWENIPFLYHTPKLAAHKNAIFDAADLFLPVSNRAKEVLILEGVPEKKIHVLMSGVDVHHFRPMKKDPELLQQFGCSQADTIVLFVGNLYREKGVFDLLFAFRRVLNRLRETAAIKLLLAGKGKEKDVLVQLVSTLRLGNNVRLIGSYPYAAMPKIHNLADVFVLPSIPISTWQEQFGYVLVESMACGKPVISTMSGSIPEVVADAGLLVLPSDFISLATALEDLVTDEHKRRELGQRGRSRAESVFNVGLVAQQLKYYYETVLGND